MRVCSFAPAPVAPPKVEFEISGYALKLQPFNYMRRLPLRDDVTVSSPKGVTTAPDPEPAQPAPPAPTTARYVSSAMGEYCAEGTEITSEEGCRDAAAMLGFAFEGSWEGPGDHRYCVAMEGGDGRAVYFNAASHSASQHPRPFYNSLCTEVVWAPVAARARAWVRLRLALGCRVGGTSVAILAQARYDRLPSTAACIHGGCAGAYRAVRLGHGLQRPPAGRACGAEGEDCRSASGRPGDRPTPGAEAVAAARRPGCAAQRGEGTGTGVGPRRPSSSGGALFAGHEAFSLRTVDDEADFGPRLRAPACCTDMPLIAARLPAARIGITLHPGPL